MKRYQENFRSNGLTAELLLALREHTERNKSDLIRSAIYELAKKELPFEKFQNTLLKGIQLDQKNQ